MDRVRFLPLFSVLLAGGITVGCTALKSDRLDPMEKSSIADSLISVTDAYNEAWEQLDVERISEYHADGFTYYRRGVVDTPSQADFAQSFHDNVATQITAYWADASDVSVTVLDRNSGLVAFVFRGGVETPDGAKYDYDGALTYVYERQGDGWKIVHIHESAYNPGAP